MLKHRVIPCVLLKDWQLTKSVKFGEFRTVGHPKVTARIYNSRNVDELIVFDIDASKHDTEINYEAFKLIAEECYMPLTLGGGIHSIEQVQMLLSLGADKISINTQAIRNRGFINEVAQRYGSQCVVVSVDVKKDEMGHYQIISHGKSVEGLELTTYLQECEAMGAGEFLLTNVEHDGMEIGYDLALLKSINQQVSVPIIINGGAGALEHCLEAIQQGADAIAAASIFHFTQHTPNSIKKFLSEHDIPTRC